MNSEFEPARLILPALRWAPDSGFDHLHQAAYSWLEAGVGGFIVFGGTAEAVATMTSDLTDRAGRPLLFAADLERGAGQQFAGLTELPPPGALGSLGDLDAIRRCGFITATEARSVGINLVLAPVADLDIEPDNPIVQSRSFGADPPAVGRAVAAWVDGCQSGGCGACVKHFPGHGRTTTDSHAALPRVTATRSDLDEDLVPFRAAIDAGVAAVMTAHVIYQALDPDEAATYSPVVFEFLRTELGFEGLAVTDALNMAGARRSDGGSAVAAVQAGIDVLLYPDDVDQAVADLQHAVRDGDITSKRMTSSRERIDRVLERMPPASDPEADAGAEADALADRLLAGGGVRGDGLDLSGPLECIVVDDDQGGPFPPNPTDAVVHGIGRMSDGDGSKAKVALLFCEPRGWKERAGLSEASRAALAEVVESSALVVLFGHPRLAAQIPGDVPVLVAWHRQRLMQDAVVRWLEARHP